MKLVNSDFQNASEESGTSERNQRKIEHLVLDEARLYEVSLAEAEKLLEHTGMNRIKLPRIGSAKKAVGAVALEFFSPTIASR